MTTAHVHRASPTAPARAAGRDLRRYPVSFAQLRLWFLEQLTPGLAMYHMPYAMWLHGPVEPEMLQRSLDAVVARHETLRTTLVAADGIPEQVVAGTGTLAMQRVDLAAGLTQAERTRQATTMAFDSATRPFDLTRGPLARALLIRTAPDEHLLVLTFHHLIADAGSMLVLTREVSRAYRAALSGAPAHLAPLALQYGDYAIWQADRLRGGELRRQLSFWQEYLRGAPAVLNLPTVHTRPAAVSYRGTVSSIRLEPATVRRLRDLAKSHDATTFMVLLAGFTLVLARYSRQRDIVVATPVAGRTHAELDSMIGLFVNTVALRTRVGDIPFVELVRHIQASTADALSHQELPFEKLVEELAPQRSLAHAPVCQVQFSYLPSAPPVLDLPEITASAAAIGTNTSKFDLTLYAEGPDDGDTVVLALEYSTDLFDGAWARRFLGCLATVFVHVAESPTTRVADVPMLRGDQHRELVVTRNAAAATAARHDHEDVLSALGRSISPVCGPDAELTMAQMCIWAARIARVLRQHGVGPDLPVGLCVQRGTGMLAGLLGVWWAGGAYVPLDPSFPPARLAAMAHDAGVRVIVSDASAHRLASSITGGGAPENAMASGAVTGAAVVVCVDGPQVAAAQPLPPVPVSADALAYVIFTSGSTGRPKGVCVEHRGVANLLGSFARSTPLVSADTFVAVTTLSFDIAVLELLLPPLSGARLVIASAEQARDGGELRTLIERVGATAMQATPQTWRLLTASGGVPASLRLRLCGGEALPRDLADELLTPAASLWNLYGPTETTVWSAAGAVVAGSGPVELGPPIDHTRVYVLDEWHRPVPEDVVGEVYLAGRGVARGYLNQPRLTAQQFRPDPYGSEPGARMYRTGDLGRWRAGAGLELLGRTDHQVKVRGYRIECGEVEALLRTHPHVRQAAVTALTRGDETLLVAHVVLRRHAATAPAGELTQLLRAHLRTMLPEHMLPTLVVALPALPLTGSGKVDRAALPAPDWATAVATDRVAPRNAVEQGLAEIWTDLLELSTPVGAHDSLFALGGHSLTATRLVARVRERFGVDLAVHHIFATPTIAELAAVISADPDFGRAAPASLYDTLEELTDEDLDELIRAALEVRRRRQDHAERHVTG